MPVPPLYPCLVTGGHGFVGQGVVQTLVRRGHPIRLALRRPWDGPMPEQAQAWIGPMESLAGALSGCATVLHLAARAHVPHDDTPDQREVYRAVNTRGALRLAEQAAAAGVRRFVFVSTVKVHGEATRPGRPFTEAMQPAPADPYALSKWEAEQGLAAIAARTGMEVVIVRPPLVYG